MWKTGGIEEEEVNEGCLHSHEGEDIEKCECGHEPGIRSEYLHMTDTAHRDSGTIHTVGSQDKSLNRFFFLHIKLNLRCY